MQLIARSFDELSTRELYEILKSRDEIFSVGQKILYVDEDNVDYACLHLFFWSHERVVAYLRAYRDPKYINVVKFGRVLSLEHGKGIGRELMEQSMVYAKEVMGCNKITLDAQVQAEGFYKKLGFSTVSSCYMEAGIPHVDMEKKL